MKARRRDPLAFGLLGLTGLAILARIATGGGATGLAPLVPVALVVLAWWTALGGLQQGWRIAVRRLVAGTIWLAVCFGAGRIIFSGRLVGCLDRYEASALVALKTPGTMVQGGASDAGIMCFDFVSASTWDQPELPRTVVVQLDITSRMRLAYLPDESRQGFSTERHCFERIKGHWYRLYWC